MESQSSSDSESDGDQESSTHDGTSYCTQRDDESIEAVHSPISSSGDFGQVVQLKTVRKFYDHEKYTLLTTHFVPPRNYKFPTRNVGGRDRCFQYSWLEKHNGLVYSESQHQGIASFVCFLLEMGLKLN